MLELSLKIHFFLLGSVCCWPNSSLQVLFKLGNPVTDNPIMSVLCCFYLQGMYIKSYFPEKRKYQTTRGRLCAYSLLFWLSLGVIQILLLPVALLFLPFFFCFSFVCLLGAHDTQTHTALPNNTQPLHSHSNHSTNLYATYLSYYPSLVKLVWISASVFNCEHYW